MRLTVADFDWEGEGRGSHVECQIVGSNVDLRLVSVCVREPDECVCRSWCVLLYQQHP